MRRTRKIIVTSRSHAHMCVCVCYAIRDAIESLTACTYIRILYCREHSAYDDFTSPRWKGRRGEYEVSRDCQKADYAVCAYICVCTRAHVFCMRRVCVCGDTRAERTRQSRIPIAPSRYGASCGAATIKAPVTHCSYPGQWACTGDSAWFWTRLLSAARIKRSAIRRPRHARPVNKWKLLTLAASDEIISPRARFDKSTNLIMMDRWWANIMQ